MADINISYKEKSGCGCGPLLFIITFVVVIVGTIIYAVTLPELQEKVLLYGLFHENRDVQVISVEMLQYYPTEQTATAVVVYINCLYPQPAQRTFELITAATDAKGSPLTAEELKAAADQAKAEAEENHRISNRALLTLCLMSGEDFGSEFKQLQNSHTWNDCEMSAWPAIIQNINTWAYNKLKLDGATLNTKVVIANLSRTAAVAEEPGEEDAQ